MSEIVDKIRQKIVTPSEAIEEHELSGVVRLSDIPLESLRIKAMDSGFDVFNKQYILKEKTGELVIIGARTASGKTAMAVQIAQYVASQGKEVVFFSSEMGTGSLYTRMLAGTLGIDSHEIMSGRVSKSMLQSAHARLSQLPLSIVTQGCSNINLICSTARTMHRRKPLSLVVVDYIQNISSRGAYSRAQEIGKVSKMLRELAIELNCPLIAAAQLNRNAINREHKESFLPDLADLKDCGEIEQDADAVVLLSRSKPDEADVIIAKARSGRTGAYKFRWIGEQTRFEDPQGGSI